jgi:hypothetical protein
MNVLTRRGVLVAPAALLLVPEPAAALRVDVSSLPEWFLDAHRRGAHDGVEGVWLLNGKSIGPSRMVGHEGHVPLPPSERTGLLCYLGVCGRLAVMRMQSGGPEWLGQVVDRGKRKSHWCQLPGSWSEEFGNPELKREREALRRVL